MTIRRSIHLAVALGLLAVLLIGCGSPAPQPQAPANAATSAAVANGPAPLPTAEKNNVEVGPDEPQIFLLEPQDGSALDSPFYLRVGVGHFKIPIGELRIHVAIDATCTPAGGVIPEDDAQHVSLPPGALQNPRFALPLGPHRLCVQASNQENIALEGPGMTRVIDVTVQSVPEPNND